MTLEQLQQVYKLAKAVRDARFKGFNSVAMRDAVIKLSVELDRLDWESGQ